MKRFHGAGGRVIDDDDRWELRLQISSWECVSSFRVFTGVMMKAAAGSRQVSNRTGQVVFTHNHHLHVDLQYRSVTDIHAAAHEL